MLDCRFQGTDISRQILNLFMHFLSDIDRYCVYLNIYIYICNTYPKQWKDIQKVKLLPLAYHPLFLILWKNRALKVTWLLSKYHVVLLFLTVLGSSSSQQLYSILRASPTFFPHKSTKEQADGSGFSVRYLVSSVFKCSWYSLRKYSKGKEGRSTI